MFAVRAPMAGRTLALDGIPDPIFSGGLIGPGIAIEPAAGMQTVVAPVDGTLVKLYPHAFVVLHASGRGVLVHLGIDTVQMHGSGFSVCADEGSEVAGGDAVVSWDPNQAERAGHSSVCAVIVLDAEGSTVSPCRTGVSVVAEDPLFTVY